MEISSLTFIVYTFKFKNLGESVVLRLSLSVNRSGIFIKLT